MGFVMHGLDKSDYDREYGDKILLKRIISYFTPYRRNIIGMSLGISTAAIFATLVPLVLSNALDAIVDGVEQSVITNLILVVLAFGVFQFGLNAYQQILTARTVQRAVFDLRVEAFDALLRRDMSFFAENPSGKVASRVTNDSNDYGQIITLTTSLIGQVLVVIFILYFLFTTSVKLTVLTILFAPFVILTALAFRKIARRVSRSSQQILAKVNALIQETTTGIYIAKSFRAEQTIYDEFAQMNKTSYEVNWKRGAIFNSIFPILNILIGIGTAMIVFFGGLDILAVSHFLNDLVAFLPGKSLTVGEWFLFLQGLNLFFFPLISIASFWSQFQQGLSASERIFSLIDAENKVIQTDNKEIEDPKGEIEFKDLTFGYNDETMILENFNLHIKPGETIAIVGHTGAGKSTLGKLISRYYEYQDGQIMIDGVDIRELDLPSYRKKLSIISQEVFLFNDTIRDNLLYGIPDADDEDKIIDTLSKIDALEWVQRMENGVNTKVGERGDRLSQGQKQLIAFARILMRDPAILILDEATSSIDPLTEVLVQKAIDLILEGRTSIVIAHRLSTIRKVDRIIVMQDGKIIEEGNHMDLLQAGGHYANLYDTFFRHQSLDYIEGLAD
jgi:ABC-type multidrug transport system fused ATPase/permease subunit